VSNVSALGEPMRTLIIVVFLVAMVVFVVKAVFWAIRVDRAQRAAIDEADEIAVMRKFHETLDGTLDQIRKRAR
jgi:steroid 5-alpha reductase family enzyme